MKNNVDSCPGMLKRRWSVKPGEPLPIPCIFGYLVDAVSPRMTKLHSQSFNITVFVSLTEQAQ